MAQCTINAVQVWKDGQSISCDTLSLVSINDNLTNKATFYFQVGTITEDIFKPETEGNLTCGGESYATWAQSGFSTDWITSWACEILNLTKV